MSSTNRLGEKDQLWRSFGDTFLFNERQGVFTGFRDGAPTAISVAADMAVLGFPKADRRRYCR